MNRYIWVALATLISSWATGQDQIWTTLAPLGEPRQEVGVAELSGKIYVAGGFRVDRTTAATVEIYDPETDSWRMIEPMPVAVNHPGAATVDGRLFVVGGYRGPGLQNPTDALQVYDPSEGTWTLAASMPTARGGLAAAALDGRVYAIGGARDSAFGEVAFYDPMSDTWTSLAPLPTPRDHLGVGVIDDRIFAVGGRNQRGFTLATLEVYNPATDRWEALPDMPTGRSGHGVAVLDGCLYAFGGEGNEQDPAGMFAEVESFNAETGTWTSLPPMPTPRHGLGAVGVADRIFLPGGATVAGFGATGVHEAYTPDDCG